MNNQHLWLLQRIGREYQQASRRQEGDPMALLVQSVAIGALIFMANSAMRHCIRDSFSSGRGR